MTNRPSQAMNLSPNGCVSLGTAIHELLHAIGIAHEQSRPDRDESVTVDMSNVKAGNGNNFDIIPGTYAEGQYDFLSIMHYDAYAFAINPDKPTITQNANTGYKIGQRDGLSRYDVKHLDTLYFEENTECRGASGLAGEGCINRPDSNGNDVCSGLTTCTAGVVELCCGCGGGFKVQCYKDKECPSSPELPAPSGSACISDVTSQYAGYSCVFNNACKHDIHLSCPSGCNYGIGPGGPRVQQCDGQIDATICQNKCTIS
jgi:hypothetical protein